MAEGSLVYTTKKKCPVCDGEVRVHKLRSKIPMEKTDVDMCVHYAGVNAYAYRIWICEHCGYAEDEAHFTNGISERAKEKIRAFLNGRKIGLQFHEERTLDDGIAALKLAIYYAKLTGEETQAHLAGLNVNLAWIFREKGDSENEAAFLRAAAELYEKSLMTENWPQGSMTDTTCSYMISAIYYELQEYDHAAKFLSPIIQDKSLETKEPQIYKKAKELWTDLRDAMKAKEKA
ncbi:DUF2225 domain-containing protein [Selenomonas sp. TAMA-11512]|uniref:DUF2225 domain-containing protein n=1 Tax=Selenomonas sp. TAMA-11512 TaxID=3095337 RepID=UPI0030D144D9